MSSRLLRDKPDYAPMDAADARTLALAAGLLDESLLERWVKHQQVFLGIAEGALGAGKPSDAALAEAHVQAGRASGLSVKEEGTLSAAVRAFSTSRLAVRLLDRKLERVRQAGGPEAAALEADLLRERARLETLTPLVQRLGAEAVALLQRREGDLLPLHERATRLLSQGG
jgi:hypothetical protein